jgi:alpha-aminoadipic semialdehyde synthase
VLVCSIDNMPTQLPMESTDLFGNLVLPYAMNILQSDATKPLEEETFSPAVLGVSPSYTLRYIVYYLLYY